MSRSRGFSLMELVVVIIIVAILAALAVPKLSDTDVQASWFHEQAKAAVRFAQRQAVAQRRCVFVSLSASQPQVRLFYGSGSQLSDCTITATALTDISTGAAYALTAPSGSTVTPPTPAAFAFDSLGRTSAAVSFTAGSGTIVVNAESGYVP